MEICDVRVEVGNNELIMSTGSVARQAHGAVVARYGDTIILATATHAKEKTSKDFFPLQVEFEEKMYSAGKIPGGFIKRENRPPDHAIICGRIVDRSVRPLFSKDWKYEVQIVCMVLSSDMENPIDIIGLNAASAALSISDITFDGPVGAVRVGRIDGEFVINPTYKMIEKSDLDIIVAGTSDAIMMVEGEAAEVSEDDFIRVLEVAHVEIKKIVEVQKEMVAKCAKKKMEYEITKPAEDFVKKVEDFVTPKVTDAQDGKMKVERETAMEEIVKSTIKEFAEKEDGSIDEQAKKEILAILEEVEWQVMRKNIKEKGIRADGRKLDEIRPISCMVGLLPRTHGTGLFTRGQTQVLSIVTLGSKGDGQRVDGINDDLNRDYYHHYNFPPFSVGEVKQMRGPSRRDIGHGTLAERALAGMRPPSEEFGFSIRVVSEVLESNGSSSMASVCGSTLALMDAGVPIKRPVAGIAMGLITFEDGDFRILTDIQGLEDHYGDMDFKVAGSREGITAVQMDIKVKGINPGVMKEAMAKAKTARLAILDKMAETISEPRKELSPYAPRFLTVKIEVEKIGTIIGPGGKTIRSITEATGAQVDIEEDGSIFIFAKDSESGEKAKKMIAALTEEVEVGKIYTGKVKRIVNFGAFVEVLPQQEGLVHISQIAPTRIEKVEDVLVLGQEVQVKVREIDEMGRVNLTMLLDGSDANKPSGRDRDGDRPRGDRPGGGRPGGGRPGGDRGGRDSRPPRS